jgi:hypothetical protein
MLPNLHRDACDASTGSPHAHTHKASYLQCVVCVTTQVSATTPEPATASDWPWPWPRPTPRRQPPQPPAPAPRMGKPTPSDGNEAYRAGLCVDCRSRCYSAGRPRCNDCHRAWLNLAAPTERNTNA